MAWLVWILYVADAVFFCIGLIRNDLQILVRQGVVHIVGLDYTLILVPILSALA